MGEIGVIGHLSAEAGGFVIGFDLAGVEGRFG